MHRRWNHLLGDHPRFAPAPLVDTDKFIVSKATTDKKMKMAGENVCRREESKLSLQQAARLFVVQAARHHVYANMIHHTYDLHDIYVREVAYVEAMHVEAYFDARGSRLRRPGTFTGWALTYGRKDEMLGYCIPSGHGKFSDVLGNQWTGHFVDGLPEGNVLYVSEDNRDQYTGGCLGGFYNGHGVLVYTQTSEDAGHVLGGGLARWGGVWNMVSSSEHTSTTAIS